MGVVDVLADVAGLLIPCVPSAGLKAGIRLGAEAVETTYDVYKATNKIGDSAKVAKTAKSFVTKGDNVLEAADNVKDFSNANYLQDSLDSIVKTAHPNPKKGFDNTYALTSAKDGSLILSKNRGIPGPKARAQAERIFGQGNVKFAGGRNSNLDLDLLKSKGISTKGINKNKLHHAEPRAVQYMLKNNIPTDSAIQVVSRRSCESCYKLQGNLGWR